MTIKRKKHCTSSVCYLASQAIPISCEVTYVAIMGSHYFFRITQLPGGFSHSVLIMILMLHNVDQISKNNIICMLLIKISMTKSISILISSHISPIYCKRPPDLQFLWSLRLTCTVANQRRGCEVQ